MHIASFQERIVATNAGSITSIQARGLASKGMIVIFMSFGIGFIFGVIIGSIFKVVE